MTAQPDAFSAIEIDTIDAALAETAKRKQIPSLKIERDDRKLAKSEKLGGDLGPTTVGEGVERRKSAIRRRPISLEVPDYLARALKIKAASQGVTVKHLILQALSAQGYAIDPSDMEEDGRRLR